MKKVSLLLIVLLSLGCSTEDEPAAAGSGTNGTGNGNPTTGGSTTSNEIVFPKLIWPIANELHDKTYISNYVDLDGTTGTNDYECRALHTYDGHTGLDIAAFNFRLMDQGVGIVAAADGVVTWTEDFNFDRNYWPPYQGSHNGVVITYPDGAFTAYAHMRKNSVAVNVAEEVKAGDFLGYMGSSGATPIPHLHFANRTKDNVIVDPFNGSCRDGDSYWVEQPNYVGSELRIFDADIFTEFSLVGGYQNGENKTFKDRPLVPAVYGIDQQKLGLWVQLQGNISQRYTIEIWRPNGDVFINEDNNVETKRRYGWYGHNWDFSSITGSDFGTWTYSVSGGMSTYEGTFEVGPVTEYGPRFYPLAGKSLKVSGGSLSDQLILHESSPDDITYELVDAPGGTSIVDNTVIIGTGQVTRNHFFQVKAIDLQGRYDLMYYHIIDLSKPL